jgi:hypothetical protein
MSENGDRRDGHDDHDYEEDGVDRLVAGVGEAVNTVWGWLAWLLLVPLAFLWFAACCMCPWLLIVPGFVVFAIIWDRCSSKRQTPPSRS